MHQSNLPLYESIVFWKIFRVSDEIFRFPITHNLRLAIFSLAMSFKDAILSTHRVRRRGCPSIMMMASTTTKTSGRGLLLIFFIFNFSFTLAQKLSGNFRNPPPPHFSIVVANSPSVTNCYPFGGGNVGWGNYLFFTYANLPAVSLVPGDILAFDLGAANDYTPAFASIAMATPSQDSAGLYTTIVPDSAANSKGDTIIGNFDLRFTITSSYSFTGGTLIIRFQNGGSAATTTGFFSDSSCDQVHVAGSSGDLSG
jgi:hypothetical protein